MKETAKEAMSFVRENDVRFIRLAFCDVFGVQKNISIMPQQLARAFESGISFDASAVRGFLNVEESDLFLHPDPASMQFLPWRPAGGRIVRFFCDIKYPDGTPFESEGRAILKRIVKQAAEEQYVCKIGPECEFYLFEADEHGEPTRIPYDRAGYLDIAPADKSEGVRREICLALEEMGIHPESSHHEQGPGQNEIDFQYADALTAADHVVTFKSVVKTIAAQSGLYASFLPKPLLGAAGSGMHINISLSQHGENIFKIGGKEHDPRAASFVAGVMQRIPEITVFLNPTVNSYDRFGEFEAPRYVTWSPQNRSPLIRIPAAMGEYTRMELRSADACANPYLAFALLIAAGMEGIQNKSQLPPPANRNLFTAPQEELAKYQSLPKTLSQAIETAQGSDFVKTVLPEKTINWFLAAKKEEWARYRASTDKLKTSREMYFLNE